MRNFFAPLFLILILLNPYFAKAQDTPLSEFVLTSDNDLMRITQTGDTGALLEVQDGDTSAWDSRSFNCFYTATDSLIDVALGHNGNITGILCDSADSYAHVMTLVSGSDVFTQAPLRIELDADAALNVEFINEAGIFKAISTGGRSYVLYDEYASTARDQLLVEWDVPGVELIALPHAVVAYAYEQTETGVTINYALITETGGVSVDESFDIDTDNEVVFVSYSAQANSWLVQERDNTVKAYTINGKPTGYEAGCGTVDNTFIGHFQISETERADVIVGKYSSLETYCITLITSPTQFNGSTSDAWDPDLELDELAFTIIDGVLVGSTREGLRDGIRLNEG